MNLRSLLEGMATDLPDREVVDVCADSRSTVRGGLFLACDGGRRHGLQFLGEALAGGVGAVAWEPTARAGAPVLPPGVSGIPVPGLHRRLGEIADRFFARPSAGMAVTGITGTNGKTTTAWLLVQALERLGLRAGYMGTLGHGLGIEVRPGPFTTPDCLTVHRQLRALADGGAGHVITEVSSHALAQGRVDGVRFHTAAFTNLTRDHLDYHPDLASYGAAKARLFTLAAPGTAVLNVADPFGAELAGRLPPAVRRLTVSLDPARPAELSGQVVGSGPEGLSLVLADHSGQVRLQSPLWGAFNAENLLLAAGILRAHGFTLDAVAGALARCVAPPGRMQRIPGPAAGPVVIVDFAHTPDALGKALGALRDHCAGRIWCVFGCGGDRDPGKRPQMGATAAALADEIVITDDNPRSEDPKAIVRQIVAGIPASQARRIVHERAAAIALAIGLARPGDAVLIAGKGHETTQSSGDTVIPFSDAEIAAAVLTPL